MKNDSYDEGIRWLQQSRADLEDARYLYEGKRYNSCCFFCQQAAEKAIKGFLYKQGAEQVYGHSVADLCLQAARVDQSFAEIKIIVSPLDVYYIPTRYPNGLPGGLPSEVFTQDDADRALQLAEKVIQLVEDKLDR